MSLTKLILEHVYDDLLKLKREYEEANNKLAKDNTLSAKEFKFKQDRLYNNYLKQKEALSKGHEDAHAFKGDKTANFIYHYTDLESLIGIITENEVIPSEDGVSFSTHSNLYKRGFVFTYNPDNPHEGRNNMNMGVKIQFDYKKMKRELKDDYKFILGNEDMGTFSGEEEIRIVPKNFNKSSVEKPIEFITEVILIMNKITKHYNYEETQLDNAIQLLDENNIKYKIIK